MKLERGVCTSTALPAQIVRFAAFEFDRQTGELRKRGIKIKLQDKPVQILALLLDRAGETVSRAEIRDRLWPEDTFVDFENSISAGVRKVREVLGDNSDSPRFIETVARHGYRFICPVSREDGLFVTGRIVPEVAPIPVTGTRQEEKRTAPQLGTNIDFKRLSVWVLTGLSVVFGLVAAWFAGRRSAEQIDDIYFRTQPFPASPISRAIRPMRQFHPMGSLSLSALTKTVALMFG